MVKIKGKLVIVDHCCSASLLLELDNGLKNYIMNGTMDEVQAFKELITDTCSCSNISRMVGNYKEKHAQNERETKSSDTPDPEKGEEYLPG